MLNGVRLWLVTYINGFFINKFSFEVASKIVIGLYRQMLQSRLKRWARIFCSLFLFVCVYGCNVSIEKHLLLFWAITIVFGGMWYIVILSLYRFRSEFMYFFTFYTFSFYQSFHNNMRCLCTSTFTGGVGGHTQRTEIQQ